MKVGLYFASMLGGSRGNSQVRQLNMSYPEGEKTGGEATFWIGDEAVDLY